MCDIGWKAPLGVDERRITGDSLAREGVPLSMGHADVENSQLVGYVNVCLRPVWITKLSFC